jgi:hypothetical protein
MFSCLIQTVWINGTYIIDRRMADDRRHIVCKQNKYDRRHYQKILSFNRRKNQHVDTII